MRYATCLVLGAVVVALCGCGSSSSRPTIYSVQQVEAAFEAHGLPLHQVRLGSSSGFVKLLGPGGLEVDVAIPVAHNGTVTLRMGTAYISVSGSVPVERNAAQRNVIVTWAPRFTKPVRAALHQLG